MLNVSGIVVIPSEPRLRINESGKGSFINFDCVSIDAKKIKHRYSASMYVPQEEVDDWTAKIEAGNVFVINHGQWSMRDNPDFKYPIPQLNLDRFNFKKLVTPFWIEVQED